MDISKAAYSVIGLVIAVLIVATVAAPIISEAQSQSEPVTLYNESALYFREAQAGDTLIGVRDDSSGSIVDTWTLNGVVLNTPTWNSAVFSDGFYLTINSASNASMGAYYDLSDSSVQAKYFGGLSDNVHRVQVSFAFYADHVTVTGQSATDYSYTWCYIPTSSTDGEYYASMRGASDIVVSSVNDIIYCGAYTTGSNNSTYYGVNGEITASAGSASVAVSTEAHDNTTLLDVKSIVITIGSETFTPYFVLVPYEVHGYATSGGNMSLLGVVALLLFIVPVMMAVRMISGRDE